MDNILAEIESNLHKVKNILKNKIVKNTIENEFKV
jgi:hypothetical protein